MAEGEFTVVDLFSGAGGMSLGFARHPSFRVVGAVDAEIGKPSSGDGKLQCNRTYSKNIGVYPSCVDLSTVEPSELKKILRLDEHPRLNVLTTCPPCTGFTRANPQNHLRDDKRNSLVRKSAEFAVEIDADIVVMENARELIRGNFTHHYEWFREHLHSNGYEVLGTTYLLSQFGLPQLRERAIVVSAKRHLSLRTLDDLWRGWFVKHAATTVRRAFEMLSSKAPGKATYPRFASDGVRARIAAIPKNGGSWMDLLDAEDGQRLLTGAMKRIASQGRIGSYPDVYGRMAWDRPAPTIKRECAHVGNGRYAHPEEDRLCSVREMAMLQGFPNDFVFNGAAISNMYRHIGDAVPPLLSYQLAWLCHWILTDRRPKMSQIVLKGTSLKRSDLLRTGSQESVSAQLL